MKKLASLLIKINANGAEAEKVFRTLEASTAKFGKKMQKVGGDLSKYVTAPLTALAGLSVKAANTQQQAEAKLLNALKGREDIQNRLLASATELQTRTTVADSAIVEQQAFLAALGMSEAQINSTIEAAVQLSAAMGMTLESAVKNLAKTYGGLTGELGESIPALKNLTVEELKAGEAINFVNQNYKGFAETAATTGVGSLQQLKNLLVDLGEQIGTILIPILQKIVEKLKDVATWFKNLSPETKKWIVGIGAAAAALGPLLVGIGKLAIGLKGVLAVLPTLSAGFTAFCATPLGAMIAGVLALAAAWQSVINSQEEAERRAAEIERQVELEGRQAAYDRAKSKYASSTLEDLKRRESVLGRLYDEERASWESSGSEDARKMANEYAMRLKAVRDLIAVREQEKIVAQSVYNAETEGGNQTLGILGQLQQKLQDLEELRPFAQSEEALAGLNAQIAETRAEIERLDKVMPTFEKFGTITANVANNLNSLSSMGTIKPGEIIPIDPVAVETELEEKTKLLDAVSSALVNSMTGLADAIGEGIGSMINGEDFNPIQALLRILGDLLKQLGTALISYSGIMETIKAVLASAGVSKGVALVAGLAAIAAGVALQKVASKPVKLATGGLAYGPTLAVVGDNPGASSDPEVIAPLSKLSNMLGGQRMELIGDVEFIIAGDTMRALLNRENMRLSRLG